MKLEIRRERESEHRAVEELTREAFWNLYVPGCNDHFVVHTLRDCPEFIPELDLVATVDGQLVGNIVYSKSTVTDAAGVRHEAITFGPVSVLPTFQKQGIGSALIKQSTAIAKDMGYSVILIYGDPRYYSRFGFRCAEKYDIAAFDGKYAVALLALPLQPNALNAISGRFKEAEAFNADEEAFAAFDATFPAKERLVTKSQQEFQIMASLRY